MTVQSAFVDLFTSFGVILWQFREQREPFGGQVLLFLEMAFMQKLIQSIVRFCFWKRYRRDGLRLGL